MVGPLPKGHRLNPRGREMIHWVVKKLFFVEYCIILIKKCYSKLVNQCHNYTSTQLYKVVGSDVIDEWELTSCTNM